MANVPEPCFGTALATHTLAPSCNALFSESALLPFPLPEAVLAASGFFCAPRREGEIFSLARRGFYVGAWGTTAFPTRLEPVPPAGGGGGGFHSLTIASREDAMNESTSLDDASTGYTKIQCIGMCLCTTPSGLNSIEETSDDGYYAGLNDVAADVAGRLTMLEQAISTAAKGADPAATTLKVFVVPEFYFRGNKGAYCTDGQSSLSFYETYLKNALERIITSKDASGKPRFHNWLFVLGSLLTSGSSVNPDSEPTKSLYPTGDSLLDIYYKLYPKPKADGANGENLLRSMLRYLDGKDENALRDLAGADAAYLEVLKRTLDACDRLAGITVTNDCYIVGHDGTRIRTLRVLKEFKSKEDFVLNSKGKDGKANGYLQTITKYKALPSTKRNEVKGNALDDYSIFCFGKVWIGVDICLDHSRQRLFKHLQKHTNNYVDLQIIPSCGMQVKANAVIARTGCHVFNCDGEYNLDDGSKNGTFSHTTLQQVATQISPTQGSEATLYGPQNPWQVETMTGNQNLYRFADYHLHIYAPVEVRPRKP